MRIMKVKLEGHWLIFLYRWFRKMARHPGVHTLLRHAYLETRFGEKIGRIHRKTLVLWVRKKDWDNLASHHGEMTKGALDAVAYFSYAGKTQILFYPPEEEPSFPTLKDGRWIDEEEEICGLNNCFFATETIIVHDDLRFRSPAEVALYNELKKRKLVVFPNAAEVLGGKGLKREPDFLICCKGRWGILEVMGREFHIESTAIKDHERAMLFKEHGIKCIEFFPGGRCMSDPAGVVNEFLSLLT